LPQRPTTAAAAKPRPGGRALETAGGAKSRPGSRAGG